MIQHRHLARMTMREKCAQRVFARFSFADPDYDRITDLIKKGGIGGVLLSGGSVFDVTPTVNAFQKISKFPLLIGGDYLQGVGREISGAAAFPPHMALGASGSEELAELKGRLTATEAVALGVPWILAPVVDLGTSDVRCFGNDPEEVARLARAFVRGVHMGRGMACARHFPGPGAEGPVEHLLETTVKPYLDLALEIDTVMTAHAPAKLSRKITRGLLRRTLLFEGMVCTEPLEGADLDGVEQCGADVLLCPDDPEAAITMLEKGVKEGRIEEVALDTSVERILTLKEKAGLFDGRVYDMRTVETWVGCGAHRKAVQKVADAAVTLLRGPEKLEGPVAYAAVVAPGTPGDLTTFVQELSAMVEIEKNAKRCVVAAFGEPGEALAAEVNRARERDAEVVVVSFGTPEMLRAVPNVAGAVCAYGLDEASQRAAALALAGKIPFRGRLPVPSPFPE